MSKERKEEEKDDTGFVIHDRSTSIPNRWVIRILVGIAIGSPWLKDVVLNKQIVTQPEHQEVVDEMRYIKEELKRTHDDVTGLKVSVSDIKDYLFDGKSHQINP
jgi:hypothetical protein